MPYLSLNALMIVAVVGPVRRQRDDVELALLLGRSICNAESVEEEQHQGPAAELAMAVATLRRICLVRSDAGTGGCARVLRRRMQDGAAEARIEALEIARELGAVPVIERLESLAVPSAAAGA